MKFRSLAAFLAVSASLTACGPSTDNTTSPSLSAGFQAKFEPAGGIMPFPNDLYFNGSTTGQLNIPGSATVAQNGPLLEQNHLDGFGTQSDISVYFTSAIDASTITSSTVRIYQTTSDVTTKAVDTKVAATQLKMGTDFTAEVSPGSDSGGSILTIKPLHPLTASSIDPTTQKPVPATYVVVVTNGLKDMGGDAASASPDYSKILAADLPVLSGGKMGTTGDATLDQVALFTLPQLAVAAAEKVDPTTIAVTFSFSTEYLHVALAEVAASATATAQPAGVGVVDTTENVCDVLFADGKVTGTTQPICDGEVPGSFETEVYAGTVALPYYLTVPAKGSKTALTDSWHNSKGGDIALNATDATSFVPVATVKQNVIPIIVAIPLACGAAPVNGWPVTIFQHGITRNREDVFAIASTLAVGGAPTLCTAVVAIDLPLHGVTDTTDPFYTKGFERTFDMDANGVAGATGKNIGGSGAQFINLTSTITSRDNLREGAADLINLVATLPNIHPGGTIALDGSKVFFVGHSLGGIIGTTFLGADTTTGAPKVTAGVLAMPGGHVAELLRQSAEFEPIIDQGLATQGIVKGTQEYYDFYSQAQAVVEDGDPANYAALAAQGHIIHMIEVVGGHDASSPPDQVVPNTATDVLIGQMGITTPITASAALAVGAPTLSQFTSGDHGSILDPTAPKGASATVQTNYLDVTTEMQKETGSVVFDLLGGVPAVTVTDSTFLSPKLKP